MKAVKLPQIKRCKVPMSPTYARPISSHLVTLSFFMAHDDDTSCSSSRAKWTGFLKGRFISAAWRKNLCIGIGLATLVLILNGSLLTWALAHNGFSSNGAVLYQGGQTDSVAK
jgi:hypothetical protein